MLRRLLLASSLLLPFAAAAQTPGPTISQGQVWTSDQWNAFFASLSAKADVANPTLNGTVSGSALPTLLASPPPIGGTTPSAGTFGSLTTSTSAGDSGNATIAGTLQVGGTTAISGFGTAIGQAIGPLINYQSSGRPGLLLSTQGLVLSRSSNAATNGSDFLVQRSTSFTTTDNQVRNAVRIDTTVGAGDGSQSWGLLSDITTNNANGTGAAVAGYFQATRPLGSSGQQVWALISEMRDQSNQPSSVGGAMLAQEVDLTGDLRDDGSNAQAWNGIGVRRAMQFAFHQRTPGNGTYEASAGLWFGTDNTGGDSYVDSVLSFANNAKIRAALDLRGTAKPTGSTDPIWAVTMPAGVGIDFSASASLTSNPGGRYLIYNSGGAKLQYMNGATEIASFPDGGGLTVGGTTITGFGTAIGQALGPLANFQGSGHPGLTLSDRLIFQRGSPTAGDFADIQLNRSTAFTGGTTATQLNAAFRVTTTIGANDKTQEYGIISQTVDNGAAGGLGYAAFLVSQRQVGGSDFIAGANIGGVDLTVGPSSLNTAGGVIGAEIHAGGNQADDGGNTQTWGNHGLRKLIHLSGQHTVADGLQAEISNGIWIDAVSANGTGHDNLLNFDSVIGFAVNTQARIALDTRGMIAPVGSTDPVFAVTMTAGHCIDFNGSASLTSNPGGNTLCFDSGTGKLFFSVAGAHKWSIDASGNVRSAGTNTASTTP